MSSDTQMTEPDILAEWLRQQRVSRIGLGCAFGLLAIMPLVQIVIAVARCRQ